MTWESRCANNETEPVLTDAQIQEFVQNGVLVVRDILTNCEVSDAMRGLVETLARYGVDTSGLEATGHNLAKLSSTNGSGGVLDLFYDDWKMVIASHPRLFRATTQLWDAAYCHHGETKEEIPDEEMFKWHPYGPFDCNRGFMYIDRVGYRLPTDLAEKLGNRSNPGKKSKAIQRSLTPHLDCCPDTFNSPDNTKWRPIQCFVSLTTNLEPSTGGFEAATAFHRDFERWTAERPPSIISKRGNGRIEETPIQAPCIGEYTHIRPREDVDVMQRVKHIPVDSGSAVFWDNRIPHANSYRNDSPHPRAVVYCSFLPDVEINRPYVQDQQRKYFLGENPSDQWIQPIDNGDNARDDFSDHVKADKLSGFARKLLGIDKW